MIHQLELAHSGNIIVLPSDDPEEYVMNFVGLNEVRPYAKSALFYWLVYSHMGAAEAPQSRTRYQEACESQKALLELALEKTKRFYPAFRRVIERTKVEGIKFPPLVLRDLVLHAEDIPAGRITLLGDAAHCMVPCEYPYSLSLQPLLDISFFFDINLFVSEQFAEKAKFARWRTRSVWPAI